MNSALKIALSTELIPHDIMILDRVLDEKMFSLSAQAMIGALAVHAAKAGLTAVQVVGTFLDYYDRSAALRTELAAIDLDRPANNPQLESLIAVIGQVCRHLSLTLPVRLIEEIANHRPRLTLDTRAA
jgi:hypothetical protein